MRRDPELPDQGKLTVPPVGYLHLWYLMLDGPWEGSSEAGILTRDEYERAERFRNPTSRDRYIATRSSLRHLLSAYLDRPGGEIPLEVNSEGKPALGGNLANVLTFNVSHSGEWVLLGFASGAAVGVDLEAQRPFTDILEVAARVLTAGEVEELRQMPPPERTSAFFRGWTRKEALQKARGIGIWNGPGRVAAGLGNPSDDPSVTTVQDPDISCVWTVRGVPAPVGFSAAAAMEGEGFRIEILRSPKTH